MGCYYHFCSCQEARPSLTEQDIERGNKRREMDDMRREYIKEKGYKVEECGSVTGGKVSKPMTRSKFTSEPTFPTKYLFLQVPSSKNKRGISFWLRSVRFSCSR